MKFISFFFYLILIASACTGKKTNTQDSAANTEPSQVATGTSTTHESIKSMSALVGKMPKDVKLFERYSLYPRLEKVLGDDFADFKSDWNEESPIKIDGEIIYFSGCKAGGCKENKYFITIDLVENNINVINFKNQRARSYEEGSIIGLPTKIADEFEKIRKEQGF
jgi:hypothetical protein